MSVKEDLIEMDLGINPYERELKVEATRIVGAKLGKYEDAVIEPTKAYRRLYVGSDKLELINSFTTKITHKLFNYIIYTIGYGKGYIKLKDNFLIEKFGTAKATYYKAKKELQDLRIINGSNKRGYYWVNPDIIFYGNRANAFPDNVFIRNTIFADKNKGNEE